MFGLSDRFGDHGIVGLMLCVRGGAEAEWEIDTWLMSCRVLGRELERFMLDRAIDAARQRGISRIIGVYRPTGKNTLVADLFDRLGFAPHGGGDCPRYALDVSASSTSGGIIREKRLGVAATSAR